MGWLGFLYSHRSSKGYIVAAEEISCNVCFFFLFFLIFIYVFTQFIGFVFFFCIVFDIRIKGCFFH